MTGNHRVRPDSKAGRSLIRVARDTPATPLDTQIWNDKVEARKRAKKDRKKEAKRCK